jgi:hypothetical protein
MELEAWMADIHTTSQLSDLELQLLSELVREIHQQQKVTKVKFRKFDTTYPS